MHVLQLQPGGSELDEVDRLWDCLLTQYIGVTNVLLTPYPIYANQSLNRGYR